MRCTSLLASKKKKGSCHSTPTPPLQSRCRVLSPCGTTAWQRRKEGERGVCLRRRQRHECKHHCAFVCSSSSSHRLRIHMRVCAALLDVCVCVCVCFALSSLPSSFPRASFVFVLPHLFCGGAWAGVAASRRLQQQQQPLLLPLPSLLLRVLGVAASLSLSLLHSVGPPCCSFLFTFSVNLALHLLYCFLSSLPVGCDRSTRVVWSLAAE